MMSEAAHSVADTVTEVLLFVALKRGNRRRTPKHPFGYGRETYFWAFLASLATFGLGAGFSIWQGVTTIIEGEEQGDPLISYIVLAVAFVLEGISWLKAVRQVRGAARKWDITPRRVPVPDDGHDGQGRHVRGHRRARRPGARRAGPVPRAGHRRPAVGRPVAIVIGLLLIVVAVVLGRANVSLLIGQSVSPRIQASSRRRSPPWTTSSTCRSCSPR